MSPLVGVQIVFEEVENVLLKSGARRSPCLNRERDAPTGNPRIEGSRLSIPYQYLICSVTDARTVCSPPMTGELSSAPASARRPST